MTSCAAQISSGPPHSFCHACLMASCAAQISSCAPQFLAQLGLQITKEGKATKYMYHGQLMKDDPTDALVAGKRMNRALLRSAKKRLKRQGVLNHPGFLNPANWPKPSSEAWDLFGHKKFW